jgi:hypothetical protein
VGRDDENGCGSGGESGGVVSECVCGSGVGPKEGERATAMTKEESGHA